MFRHISHRLLRHHYHQHHHPSHNHKHPFFPPAITTIIIILFPVNPHIRFPCKQNAHWKPLLTKLPRLDLHSLNAGWHWCTLFPSSLLLQFPNWIPTKLKKEEKSDHPKWFFTQPFSSQASSSIGFALAQQQHCQPSPPPVALTCPPATPSSAC